MHCKLLFFVLFHEPCPFTIVALAYHLEMICFSTASTCLPIWWTLFMWVAVTTVTTFLFHLFWCFGKWFWFLFNFLDFIASKFFVFLKLCNITVCDLWASTHLAHASTCSLVTILMSFMAVSLHMICINMSLSFKPMNKLFFNHLSASLELYSATLSLSLPIQPSEFFPLCILNLQYWRYLMVSLCCG